MSVKIRILCKDSGLYIDQGNNGALENYTFKRKCMDDGDVRKDGAV